MTANCQDSGFSAANLGDDADATAAISRKISTADYVAAGNRQHWLNKVVICEMAERLS